MTFVLPIPDSARGPDGDQHAEFRAQLLEQRHFRQDQIRALSRDGRDPADAAREEVRRTLKAGARAALTDIAAALQRLDDGTYGRCVTCGSTIAGERLEILPAAADCMPCRRRSEVRA